MNPRIFHLAASYFPRDGEGNICVTPDIISEFAEALILQCLTVCEEVGDEGMDGHYCADKIKQLFLRG